MKKPQLYPLRFKPIYQYRLWGARRLEHWLSLPLPPVDPIGEAWILSDRDDFPSIVSEGHLKGQSIAQLLMHFPNQLLGKHGAQNGRFPLLLKLLDAKEVLSVQVHPSDDKKDFIPPGEHGKTEAWVVLDAGSNSQVFSGLLPGSTEVILRDAIKSGTLANHLASFTPNLGDAVFIEAGTVHTIRDVVVFEVQENSDVTFRLDDWGRIDAKTGSPRPLQIDQALACIDFDRGPGGPVIPLVEENSPVHREQLFHCKHFGVWRLIGDSPFMVGSVGVARVIVCIGGNGLLDHAGETYTLRVGDTMLLPASVGACFFRPEGTATVLEISLPEAES